MGRLAWVAGGVGAGAQRGLMAFASALCLAAVLAPAGMAGEEESPDIAAFRRAVAGEFEALRVLKEKEVDASWAGPPKGEMQTIIDACAGAEMAFAKAVGRHWPFKNPKADLQAQWDSEDAAEDAARNAAASAQFDQLMSRVLAGELSTEEADALMAREGAERLEKARAKEAARKLLREKKRPAREMFEAAERFREEAYFEGKATREEAIARYLEVADQFPGTDEHDNAVFYAWVLCVQWLHGGAAFDLKAGQVFLDRLIAQPGRPSSWVIEALHERCGHHADPVARMRARSAFYGRARDWSHDPEWLAKNVLVPSPEMTPGEFYEKAVGILATLAGSQQISRVNMVADAALSPDPLLHLNWLAKEHPGDELAQKEIAKAVELVLRRAGKLLPEEAVTRQEVEGALEAARLPEPKPVAGVMPPEPPSQMRPSRATIRLVAGAAAVVFGLAAVAFLFARRRGARGDGSSDGESG